MALPEGTAMQGMGADMDLDDGERQAFLDLLREVCWRMAGVGHQEEDGWRRPRAYGKPGAPVPNAQRSAPPRQENIPEQPVCRRTTEARDQRRGQGHFDTITEIPLQRHGQQQKLHEN